MIDLAMLHMLVLFAAAMALLFAAAHDLAVRTVPNGVPLIVAASGLGLHVLDRQLIAALVACTVVFAGAWFCWRRGWIGGGDVKLISACALLVSPGSVPELILSTAVAGGALALCYVALARLLRHGVRPRPAGLMRRIWRAERRRICRGLSLPYSCAIATGALLTVYLPLG